MRNYDQEFFLKTQIGILLVEVLNDQISRIAFHQPKNHSTGSKPAIVVSLEQQLLEYFNSHRKVFDIPIKMHGTPFQLEIWQKLLEIPYGNTISYGKLAAQLGDIKKVRAVANAVGKNPLPIIVPCHRVVGMHGQLTGYIGGLPLKKFLIEIESAKQLRLFN